MSLAKLCDLYCGQPGIAMNTGLFREMLCRYVREWWSRTLHTMQADDFYSFQAFLENHPKKLGLGTRQRYLKGLSSLMQFAANRRIITHNPFVGLSQPDIVSRERQVFVTPEVYRKVMKYLSPRSGAVFALARYGGVRIPSEIERMTWGDIDFENAEIRVLSPKTAHCGMGERWIPMFEELRTSLLAYRETIADLQKDDYLFSVATTYYPWAVDMRKAIVRAKVKPWPKLFINCRSSRATELIKMCAPDTFQLADVGDWMGHSATTLIKYYAQVNSEARRRAATLC